MVGEGVDFSKVHKAFPQIMEEEWRIFKENCALAETQDKL
jgi:succinate dehydrogenase/fumarate reductase flavoprotein subunit